MVASILKQAVEWGIRQKTSEFRFAPEVSLREILTLSFGKGTQWFRGLFLGRGKVFREAGVRVRNKSKVRLGNWVRLERNVHLDGFGSEGLTVGDRSRIGAMSRLVVSTNYADPGKFIRIGEDVGIGEFAYLGGAGGLTIGDGTIIGQYFSCHPENHNFSDPELPIRLQGCSRQGIEIGANCWIGAKVTVLDGVSLGRGCVVAAGAVVNQSFPEGSIIGGVPARMLKRRGTEP